jgi:ABC-type xylose transport system permease subunit
VLGSLKNTLFFACTVVGLFVVPFVAHDRDNTRRAEHGKLSPHLALPTLLVALSIAIIACVFVLNRKRRPCDSTDLFLQKMREKFGASHAVARSTLKEDFFYAFLSHHGLDEVPEYPR